MTLFYLYAFSFPGNKLHPRIKNSLIGLLQHSRVQKHKENRREKKNLSNFQKWKSNFGCRWKFFFLSLVLTLSDNFDWWILILKVNHMPRRKYKLWGVINFTIRTHGLNANFQFIVHVETLNTPLKWNSLSFSDPTRRSARTTLSPTHPAN